MLEQQLASGTKSGNTDALTRLINDDFNRHKKITGHQDILLFVGLGLVIFVVVVIVVAVFGTLTGIFHVADQLTAQLIESLLALILPSAGAGGFLIKQSQDLNKRERDIRNDLLKDWSLYEKNNKQNSTAVPKAVIKSAQVETERPYSEGLRPLEERSVQGEDAERS